jgi:hypothetical protein
MLWDKPIAQVVQAKRVPRIGEVVRIRHYWPDQQADYGEIDQLSPTGFRVAVYREPGYYTAAPRRAWYILPDFGYAVRPVVPAGWLPAVGETVLVRTTIGSDPWPPCWVRGDVVGLGTGCVVVEGLWRLAGRDVRQACSVSTDKIGCILLPDKYPELLTLGE